MNRYRILRARPAVLLGMLVSLQNPEIRDALRVSGLPEDARLLRTAYDPVTDVLLFFVHSETFGEVPDGGIAPDLQPAISMEQKP